MTLYLGVGWQSRDIKRILATSITYIAWTMVSLAAHAASDRTDNAANEFTSPGPSSEAIVDRIGRLVNELGADVYVVRRAAQQGLEDLGIDAFDQLYAATAHVDPEIANTARHLLLQITVPWNESSDPDVVRLMKRYGELSSVQRMSVVAELSALKNQLGITALTRILRFDRSEVVSRFAATAILSPRESQSEEAIDLEFVTDQLQYCMREGANWIRIFAIERTDPSSTLGTWENIVAAELKLLDGIEEGAKAFDRGQRTIRLGATRIKVWDRASSAFSGPNEQTNDKVVEKLMWHLLRQYDTLRRTDDVVRMLRQIVDRAPDRFESRIIEVVQWLRDAEAWDVFDVVMAEYDQKLAKTRRAQYLAAIAYRARGDANRAEELAKRSFETEPRTTIDRVMMARYLQAQSEYDWAEREFVKTANAGDDDSPESSLIARTWFSSMLHDLERHDEAAAELKVLQKAIDDDMKFRQKYNRILVALEKSRETNAYLLRPKQIAARYHYYMACHYRENGDLRRQRQHLSDSINLDGGDADVLIAMYRVADSDATWRQEVFRRIEQLSRDFQETIDQNPEDPQAYNQWAWLISNTEGDYRRAIEYSQRSIELYRTAGFLDTLGRCYFAAGDYANAVKYQREAVELEPSVQVMHRQLAEFETALAAQGASSLR